MISAIKITPLNTTNELLAKCKYCDFEITIKLGQSINVDSKGNLPSEFDKDFECENCGKSLAD
jgi:DNA-directed RNA polymerase subunit RPC12/RpoP